MVNYNTHFFSFYRKRSAGDRERRFHLCGILLFFAIWMMIGGSLPATATIFTSEGEELNETGLYLLTNSTEILIEQDIPIFFYDPMCGACFPAHEYLDQYIASCPGTEIRMLSLSAAPENRDLFYSFRDTYNRNKTYIPGVYFGPVVLEGPRDIETYFSYLYDWFVRQKEELSNNSTSIHAT